MGGATERYNHFMETKKFIYFEDEGMFVGWLEEYPDYRTQGETLDELKENLLDIYKDVSSGAVQSVRRVGELVVG